MTADFTPKSAEIFYCDKCDFKCCKKSDLSRHVLTLKHLNTDKILPNTADFTPKSAESSSDVNTFVCECGKSYRHRQSLFNHRKKCITHEQKLTNIKEFSQSNDTHELAEIMKYLMKENSEMKNMMMKVIENGTHNTTNNTNSHNKAFNLNFFLNETCKDAMNIMEFVESIKLQLSDLEKVGEIGYVEGISNIIVKNLNDLDVTQRPVHCTDKKRETMYIKDEDKWEKDEENSKIKKVIKKVASKNQRLITKFKETHPDCIKYHSKYSDQYNKIIVESMGGSGDNDTEKEEKIIRNISKNVVVDK